MPILEEMSFQCLPPEGIHPQPTSIRCARCAETNPSLLAYLLHMNHKHPNWVLELFVWEA